MRRENSFQLCKDILVQYIAIQIKEVNKWNRNLIIALFTCLKVAFLHPSNSHFFLAQKNNKCKFYIEEILQNSVKNSAELKKAGEDN